MAADQTSRLPDGQLRDFAWLILAGLFGAAFLVTIVGAVASLLAGDWVQLLLSPIGLVLTYWIAIGAWGRTVWGRPDRGLTP